MNEFTQTHIRYIPHLVDIEFKHLIQFGFAPGGYMSVCRVCEYTYSGLDKRASTCYHCAKSLYDEKVLHDEILKTDGNFDLLKYAASACREAGNTKRDQADIMLSLTEEVGELAVEVKIDRGLKNREHSDDGVVGEAIDVIIVALDIIHSEEGQLDHEKLDPIFKAKLDKWIRKKKEL